MKSWTSSFDRITLPNRVIPKIEKNRFREIYNRRFLFLGWVNGSSADLLHTSLFRMLLSRPKTIGRPKRFYERVHVCCNYTKMQTMPCAPLSRSVCSVHCTLQKLRQQKPIDSHTYTHTCATHINRSHCSSCQKCSKMKTKPEQQYFN